jgi:hypothetical protein
MCRQLQFLKPVLGTWLLCGRIVEFFLCCGIMRNTLQPVTGNIFFVSPQWQERRLNLVATDFICTQCLTLCLTSQADLYIMAIMGHMCILCAAKVLFMLAVSGLITWYTVHRNPACVSFVEEDCSLAVNSGHKPFHIQGRSHACAQYVARDTYSVEIYGGIYWLT